MFYKKTNRKGFFGCHNRIFCGTVLQQCVKYTIIYVHYKTFMFGFVILFCYIQIRLDLPIDHIKHLNLNLLSKNIVTFINTRYILNR